MATIQTRSEENGLSYYATLNEALDKCEADKTIWKISFKSETNEYIRLVKTDCGWTLENMYGIIADVKLKK